MPHASEPRLLVLHGLRLKGFAEANVVADAMALDQAVVDEHLELLQAESLVLRRDGRLSGWALTPTGRKEDERLLAEELDRAGIRDVVDGAYRRFAALNNDFLALCTDWQLRPVDGQQVINDHSDAAYDAGVIERLVAHHDIVRPITADLRDAFDRFSGYGPRLRTALERVVAGEHDWFTKPVIESYHTVWFELHEDLLATLGIERSKEGAS